MWPTTKITLLQKLRNMPDDGAWRRFVDLYSPVVYDYCRRRGMQDADAQNVVQNVLLHLSRAMHNFQYDAERGPFRKWLGLITHQQLLRYLRKQSRSIQGGGQNTLSDWMDSFEGESEGAWIEAFNSHIYARAIANVRKEFDSHSWRAFERVWDGNERPRDVASAMQKETHWVYQLKHRIVSRIKEEVERLSADAAILHRS